MYPLGDLDPMARLRQQNPYLPQPARPTIQPLSPEEERPLLSKIGGAALGGVSYAGSALEKAFGGRAVRGLLGGKPRELLSVLPFSDTLGITDYDQRVSGKELLGFRPEDDSWGATLAGLGTEIALDPGTYLTFGGSALTGAGQAARAGGLLPKTLAGRATTTLSQALHGAAPEALEAVTRTLAKSGTTLAEQGGQHLGGVVGVGLPFMNPAMVFGANPGGAAFVQGLANTAKAADAAARSVPLLSKLTYSPVADAVSKGYDLATRYGRALFDNKVMGATTAEGQAAAEVGSEAGRKALAGYRKEMADQALKLKALGIPEFEGSGKLLHSALEGTVSATNPEARALIEQMRGTVARARQAGEDLGIPIKQWQDPLNPELQYFPRYSTQHAQKGGGGLGALFGADTRPLAAVDETVQSGRNPILQGFGQGTAGIEQALNDPLILTGELKASRQHLLDNYLTPPTAELLRGRLSPPKRLLAPGKEAELEAWLVEKSESAAKTWQKKQGANASKFVDYARNLAGQQAARGGGATDLFGNHPLVNLEQYLEHASKLQGAGEAGQSLLAKMARPVTEHLKPGEVTLEEALRTAGLTGAGAKDALAGRLGVGADELANLFVGPDTVRELQRYMGGFQGTEASGALLGAFDKLTNLTKAFQTAVWPAFHVRNRVSGAIQNLHEGGMGTLFQGNNVARLMRGEVIPGAAQMIGRTGMTDAEATAQIAGEMYAHGIGGHLPNISREIVGPGGSSYAGRTFDEFLQRIPGQGTPKTWTGAAKRAVDFSEPGSANLLNTQGVGANADIFSPVAGGRRFGDMVEGINRGSLYLSLRQQGMSAEQAAQRVLASHFDYTPSALTPFEKTFMRRLVPFYCVPDDCEILTRRGWLKVDELEVGEDVLTMDHGSGESSWAPCEAKSVFDYDGMLLELSNSKDRFAFTPDHRWAVLQDSRPSSGKVTNRTFVRGFELRTNHVIPRVSTFLGTESVATPREAAIVGWVVTDGYQRRRERSPNHQELVIYQSPGKHLAEIIQLLGSDGSVGKPHPETGVVPVRVVGAMNKRIGELLPSKASIVKFVCGLSRVAADACYDAMMKAEGCKSGGGSTECFAQKDGEVLDAFQILSQMVGRVANKCAAGAYVGSARPNLKIARANVGTIWYRGRVWCPQTKHGTWLMRRNGRVIWTGNSFTRHNLPYQLEALAQAPGSLPAITAKVAGGLRQQSQEFLPEYLGGGLAVPVGQEDASGVKRYLTRLDTPVEGAFEWLQGGPRGTERTLMGALGMLNPLLKGPLEYATQRQFFTGREMPDLYSFSGNPLVDQTIMSSPLSRFFTTARTLTDPAKWQNPAAIPINLLTGARMTDVDVGKMRNIAEREWVQENLRGLPEVSKFETLSVKPGLEGTLTPQEWQLLRLSKTLEKRARESKKRGSMPP